MSIKSLIKLGSTPLLGALISLSKGNSCSSLPFGGNKSICGTKIKDTFLAPCTSVNVTANLTFMILF